MLYVTLSYSVSVTAFLIYINDLCDVSRVLDLILFADGTNIFFSDYNVDFLERTLNEELLKLTAWC